MSEDEMENWINQQEDDYDYSYDTGKETLNQYFRETFKPTSKIIDNNFSFFESLKNIIEIFVLGHSISNVDLPYFKHLAKSVSPDAIWNVSYFDNEEYKRINMTLLTIGINQKNLAYFKLFDIQENNNQLKLNFDLLT